MNPLTTLILSGLAAGDKVALSSALRAYKLPTGATNYLEVLKVPLQDRIQGLIANIGFETTHKLMGAAITVAMEGLNLGRPLSGDQIVDLVDEIIESSTEDQLALEDLILFLQKLVKGEYSDTNSKMDIPIFMRLFELHRQERYRALKKHEKSEQHYFKTLGDASRGIDSLPLKRNEDPERIDNIMEIYYEEGKRNRKPE